MVLGLYFGGFVLDCNIFCDERSVFSYACVVDLQCVRNFRVLPTVFYVRACFEHPVTVCRSVVRVIVVTGFAEWSLGVVAFNAFSYVLVVISVEGFFHVSSQFSRQVICMGFSI